MTSPKIRADFDQLADISKQWQKQAELIKSASDRLHSVTSTLRNGDWIGISAERFYAEMDSSIFPAFLRLHASLEQAANITLAIREIFAQADIESAILFSGSKSTNDIAQLDDFEDLAEAESSNSRDGLEAFLEGAILGDFSENSSWLSVAGQVIIGFIPVVGQIADLRDIIAAIKKGDAASIAIAGIAIIPGFDFLKGGSKAGKKLIREAAENIDDVAKVGLKQASKRLTKETAQRAAKELRALNAGRAEILARLESLSSDTSLSKDLLVQLRKTQNALIDHLNPSDLSGALRDKLSVPVAIQSKSYNHLKEVSDGLNSINKAREQILYTLKKINPSSDQFNLLSNELSALSEYAKRINQFINIK